LDRGATWRPAFLREPNIARAWVRWDFEWDARPGDHAILTRAVDDQGHARRETTTARQSARWNFGGHPRRGDPATLTRAVDDQGNAQPATIPWNAQGYG